MCLCGLSNLSAFFWIIVNYFVILDSGKAFLDESKLSKLMRRIFSSADRERRLTAARTLKDFILSPEGNKVDSYF